MSTLIPLVTKLVHAVLTIEIGLYHGVCQIA